MANDFSERVYDISPIWLQNVLISIKGWEFRHLRADITIQKHHYNFLLASQYWNCEQYRIFQVEQLQNLLRIAFKYTPYYRDLQHNLKCLPEDFKAPEDITLLPILEKFQVRGQENLFLNESLDRKKLQKGFTSGTTGTPLNFFFSRESFSKKWAFVCRLRHWAGLSDPHLTKRAQFTGRNIIPLHQAAHIYWRRNLPGNALLFSTTHLSPETAPYYIQALHDFSPELIDGYPSALLILAKMSQRLSLPLPQPKAIIVSAETLSHEHRQEIEKGFRCKVFNQYSASEPVIFWCDCEYGVMHENSESGISEIVDEQDNPAAEGEPGTVLSTAFWNSAMILIRYRLGDMAIKGTSTLCECGRAMPRIESVEGRIDDILFIPERGYVGRLDPVFKGLSNIVEAQIIQEDLNAISVLLVPDSNFNNDIQEHLIQNLRFKLGEKVVIGVELVNKIPRGPNGKFNAVISRVKHLYPDRID